VLNKLNHLKCWRLRSADQLPTGLMLSEAPGPHLQEQAASRLKLEKATYNTKEINKSKTNNISNISIILSKIVIILFKFFNQESPSALTRITYLLTQLSHTYKRPQTAISRLTFRRWSKTTRRRARFPSVNTPVSCRKKTTQTTTPHHPTAWHPPPSMGEVMVQLLGWALSSEGLASCFQMT
jgi:hypothetical protein